VKIPRRSQGFFAVR